MPHDYWIGDRVWIHSREKEGVFEGEQDGYALVKIGSTKERFPFAEITLLPEEDDVYLDIFNEPVGQQASAPFTHQENSIDLHIEELNAALTHAEPAMILTHQVQRLKQFLDKVIERKGREVEIIHGKGEGVLRAEVLRVLDTIPEAQTITAINQEGSLRVLFKYQ